MQSRAAVLHEVGGEPLLEERNLAAPGAGEVLVQVDICGLCGSDLFLQDGGFGRDKFPVVPGHEAAGIVHTLGPGVDTLQSGEAVALYYIDNDPRGRWALSGRPNLGPGVVRMGVDCDGALADFVIRPAHTLIRPPAPIPPAELAVLTDALSTPYHALTTVARLRAAEHVLVLGLGGIGSNAVQLAAILGAEVTAIGRSTRSRDLATRLGARTVLESGPAVAQRFRAETGPTGGADLVLICSDAPGLVALAIQLCSPGGRVVLIAATHDTLDVSAVDLIWREIAILGSRGFTPDDIRAVQQLYLDGRLSLDHLTSDIRQLSAVAAAFKAMRSGGSTRILIAPGVEQ